MINYTYIVYTDSTEDNFVEIRTDQEQIYATILKYHYPICMNSTNSLRDEEKRRIINDEYGLMKELIGGYGYEILMIPRGVYDLFNILMEAELDRSIVCHKFKKNNNYDEYCIAVNTTHDDVFGDVWKLNNLIIQKIKQYGIDFRQPMDFLHWQNINTLIVRDLIELKSRKVKSQVEIYNSLKDSIISKINFIDPVILSSSIKLFQLRKRLRNFFSQISEAPQFVRPTIEKMILQYHKVGDNPPLTFDKLSDMLQDLDLVRKTIEEHNLHFNNNKLNDFIESIALNNNILQRIVLVETISDKSNKFMIYRGSNDMIEQPIDITNNNRGYSVSYNTSIFNGVFCDSTACTYYFMTTITIGESNPFKVKYTLNRHFYNDGSNESKLFFIPPLHPYVQLRSDGEFWHVRSKIFVDSEIKDIDQFAGTFREFDIMKDTFPEYLWSSYTKEEIERKFKLFLAMNRKELIDSEQTEQPDAILFGGTDSVYFAKYLKYKTKYLNMQERLRTTHTLD
jgi:hypothetical protein